MMTQEQSGWWDVYFGIKWDENTEQLWHVDLLLAHLVLKPILAQFRSDFKFWQFHRRAVRDESGHEFTFSFYSSASIALRVCSFLQADPLLKEMNDSGVVIQVKYPDPNQSTSEGIDAKSDPRWSTSMRKSWPHFIMGVCEMWLALIDELRQDSSARYPSRSLTELLTEYEETNRTINGIWYLEGNDAFLHRLNAIFGYVPILLPQLTVVF